MTELLNYLYNLRQLKPLYTHHGATVTKIQGLANILDPGSCKILVGLVLGGRMIQPKYSTTWMSNVCVRLIDQVCDDDIVANPVEPGPFAEGSRFR